MAFVSVDNIAADVTMGDIVFKGASSTLPLWMLLLLLLLRSSAVNSRD